MTLVRSQSTFFTVLTVLLLLVTNATPSAAIDILLQANNTLPSCDALIAFNSANFSNPTNFTNPYAPLLPGMQFILDGYANLGGGILPHRVILTVTDLTKVINGVETRVMWDTDFEDGELVESELAFQAQDNSGNIWVLGEYPEEYDAGEFTGAPFTWISGISNATAGVLVPGNPQMGTPPFSEGLSPSIDFSDCGQVEATGTRVCAQSTCYDNVLTINEWAPPDPESGTQQKYYAPGVGNFKIGARDDPQGETLILTSVVHLSPAELCQVRNAALELDKHGSQISPVYHQTSPAVLPEVIFNNFYYLPNIMDNGSNG